MRSLPRLDPLLRRAMQGTALGDATRVQRAVHGAMRRLGHPALPVWYHEAYRIPLPGFAATTGAQLRRADFVAWYLADTKLLEPGELCTPERISYRDLSRVHSATWLEAMHSPEALARVFATSPAEAAASNVVHGVLLACGGTLAAARRALGSRRATLNLGGGFHHAEPDKGGGYCLVNDIAVAVATLRAGGFTGRVCVLDLDAHPPDGTAACLRGDPGAWIGSISGADWGQLPGVDETLLPGAGDGPYLRALDALLRRMPRPDLAFVVAGGDVLSGDHHGGLRLTLEGARARDERVAAALSGVASVWLPSGGYHADSWRLCATTALVLAGSPAPRVPPSYDPMRRRFSRIARSLRREELEGPLALDFSDLAGDLHLSSRRPRLLGFYTAEGLEHALDQYGILEALRRQGYDAFRVEVDDHAVGDGARVFGRCAGQEHLLVEFVVERRSVGGEPVVYVHWLTLRNPLASFDEGHSPLPGQEVRGLGVGRELSLFFGRLSERLGLGGVAFTPSFYHMAWSSRGTARFVSPERQARFEAMLRDLGHLPVADVTRAVAERRVLCNGEPYAWEPDVMVAWSRPRPFDEQAAQREAARYRFEQAGPAPATTDP